VGAEVRGTRERMGGGVLSKRSDVYLFQRQAVELDLSYLTLLEGALS
jgi:hypothetical protein